jgi:hypothetical protein
MCRNRTPISPIWTTFPEFSDVSQKRPHASAKRRQTHGFMWFRDLFLLAGFLFLFDRGFGLLAFGAPLLAEDGLISLGKFFGFRQSDTNNAHEKILPY